MADAQFDIEHIKSVLRKATATGSSYSQRSLGRAAGEGRDAVGDIINDRNKNPTTKVLSNIARALGGDLSMFGLAEERTEPPTEAELEAALRDMLPGMPKGGLDRRARYLAEAVGGALKLPLTRPSSDERPMKIDSAKDAPPPAATT